MSELLTSGQMAKAVQLKMDFTYYAPRCLKIKNKGGQIIPMVLNRAQQYLHSMIEHQKETTGKVRMLVVKGRQQGISTLIEGRFYWKTSMNRGKRAYILTHLQEATDNLFDMTRRYHENCPEAMKPSTHNDSAKALTFDKLDSEFSVATAGSKGTGRSGTGQLFHGSELGFWTDAANHMAGIGQTIPNEDGTEIILESTGNGVGNLFHGMVMDSIRGDSEYQLCFIPWLWQQEYRMTPPAGWTPDGPGAEYAELYGAGAEQLYWRELKIKTDFRGDSNLFDQEYPACVTGDTRVGTDMGLIQISEARIAQIATKGSITATHGHEPSQIFKLTTEMGYTLRGTFDHPIFSAGGVLIPLAACAGRDIQLCQPMLSERKYIASWLDCGMNVSIEFGEEWGRLLGFYMGDGSLYDGCLSTVCDAGDTDVVADVVWLYKKVFDLDASTRAVGSKKGGIEVRAQNKKLIELFDRFGWIRRDGGSMRRRVHVPEQIFRSPKSVVKEFLRGLFEADGFAGYDYPRVVLFSKHREFLNDVQLLLLAFGITCRVTSKPRHNHNADGERYEYIANELTLRREEAVMFGIEIGFVSARKNGRVASWIDKSKAGRARQPLVMEDIVVSVEKDGFEQTFDLTIDDGKSFDANGIHTHNTVELAFRRQSIESLIPLVLVERAMKAKDIEATGPKIMGIDPAEYGSDDTVFVLRQGRVVSGIKRYHGRGPMEVVALAAQAIAEWEPEYINVDAGGIGSGIADRLIELNYPVYRILFGERAIEDDLYAIRKDEMGGELKAWFEDQPNQILYDDALKADLSSPSYTYDSSRRLKVETKEHLRQRGLKSPDGFDALCLTFAMKYGINKKPNRSLESPNWRTM